jgi:hypothetical protein
VQRHPWLVPNKTSRDSGHPQTATAATELSCPTGATLKSIGGSGSLHLLRRKYSAPRQQPGERDFVCIVGREESEPRYESDAVMVCVITFQSSVARSNTRRYLEPCTRDIRLRKNAKPGLAPVRASVNESLARAYAESAEVRSCSWTTGASTSTVSRATRDIYQRVAGVRAVSDHTSERTPSVLDCRIRAIPRDPAS